MTPTHRNLLTACIPALEAAETLRDRGHELGANAVKRYTLLATGDQDKAEDAFNERVLADLAAGRTPSL